MCPPDFLYLLLPIIYGGRLAMGKKRRKNEEPKDEIWIDLEKLSEYMHSLKPGEYAIVSDIVKYCAITDKDKADSHRRKDT